METRKKRKLEAAPPAQTMSAFALRKRLLQQREAAAPGPVSEPPAEDQAEELKGPQDGVPMPKTTSQLARTRGKKQTQESGQSTEAAEPRPKPSADQELADTPEPPSKRTADAASSTVTPKRQAVVLRSSFRPASHNFKQEANGSLRLKLAEGDRLVILGSYGIAVKEGEVTLAGATLRASTRVHWVHAPQCHSLPVCRCAEDATIVLSSHPSAPSLRKLGDLSPVFARLWTNQRTGPTKKQDSAESFQILYTSEDGPAMSQDLVSPPEWNKAMSAFTSFKKGGAKTGQQVLFICGPKSSGKSTFSRLLTNRLLTNDAASRGQQQAKGRTSPSVAVLDIDPGQPEYGTTGSVSLVHVTELNLSPPFCHPYAAGYSTGGTSGNRLLRSHNLASVSPATDPEHYIECVLDLYAVYCRDLRHRCPLLVNTPGWVQGTGLDIVMELITRMRPSSVLYMSQEGPEETVQGLKSAYTNVPLVELPSQPSEYTSRTAAHLRTMQAMSYFHLDADALTKFSPYMSWDVTPVTSVRPWVVPFTGSESGILGVMCYDYQPPGDLLADAINGTIVSIVAVENAHAFRIGQAMSGTVGVQDSSTAMGLEDGENKATMNGNASERDEDKTNLSHNLLPHLARSPEGIPFVPNANGSTLDPRYSHSLGLALVRGIDAENKELHLLTPLPAADALDEILRQDGLGLVLVSGKLDPPTWAYTEDLYFRKAAGSGTKEDDEDEQERDDGSVMDEDTDDHASETAEAETAAAREYALPPGSSGGEDGRPSDEIPWVEMLEGSQKRVVGSRVWRVRRDLGRNTGGE